MAGAGVPSYFSIPAAIPDSRLTFSVRSYYERHVVPEIQDGLLFPIMGTLEVRIFGEMEAAKFSHKYPASRKPIGRFLKIARHAEWPHFPAIKRIFPATDYAPFPGTLIFNIGGNKYRLVARLDFQEQFFFIEKIVTHREYDRENL